MFFYDCAVLRHIVVPPAVVVAVPMVVNVLHWTASNG